MRRALWIGAGSSLALFVLDRVTRSLAFAHAPQDILPGILRSQPTTNTGVALGIPLPAWASSMLIVVLLAVVATMARTAYRRGAVGMWFACWMVAVGAFSNVLDRLAYGHVRDFLLLRFWPTTGNLGDWYITFGAIVLILTSMPRRHTRTPFHANRVGHD